MVFHFDDYGYYGRKACFLLSWSWCVVSHLLALGSFFLFCMCFLFASCCSTSPSRLAFTACLSNKTKPTKTSTNLRLKTSNPWKYAIPKKNKNHLPTLGRWRSFFFTVGAGRFGVGNLVTSGRVKTWKLNRHSPWNCSGWKTILSCTQEGFRQLF